MNEGVRDVTVIDAWDMFLSFKGFVSDASVSTGAIALNCVIGAFCGKEAGQCTMSLVFATCMAMPEEDSVCWSG